MAEHLKVKLTKRVRKAVWCALDDFSMIENGDKIMVCLSGGKDSYTMLDMLLHVREGVGIDFEILAVNLDQKQPGFPEHTLPEYLKRLNIPYRIVEKDTYSIVKDKLKPGATMCSLCSRLRRGNLYSIAKEEKCNKIALGHHREDILETFMLNLMFSGKLEAMPPKYITDDEELVVIRPLSYCKEEDIVAYAELQDYPIIPCTLCGSQPNMQRQNIKKMLDDWEKEWPDRKEIMMTSLKNIHLSHLLDNKKYDFSDFNEVLAPMNS